MTNDPWIVVNLLYYVYTRFPKLIVKFIRRKHGKRSSFCFPVRFLGGACTRRQTLPCSSLYAACTPAVYCFVHGALSCRVLLCSRRLQMPCTVLLTAPLQTVFNLLIPEFDSFSWRPLLMFK